MPKPKKHNRFICDSCLPDVEELGEAVPGLWLGLDKKDGKHVLVGADGHGGQVFHRFSKTPWIDPLERRPDETYWQWHKRYESASKHEFKRNWAWFRMARKELGRKIALDAMMTMASMLRDGGWTKKDGCVSVWLYERCARIAARRRKP